MLLTVALLLLVLLLVPILRMLVRLRVLLEILVLLSSLTTGVRQEQKRGVACCCSENGCGPLSSVFSVFFALEGGARAAPATVEMRVSRPFVFLMMGTVRLGRGPRESGEEAGWPRDSKTTTTTTTKREACARALGLPFVFGTERPGFGGFPRAPRCRPLRRSLATARETPSLTSFSCCSARPAKLQPQKR